MRQTSLVVLSLFALCFAATQAGAVGKITVDPNVSGARVAKSEPEKDERLNQKITYEARRKTVSAILSDLSRMTGITLRAGLSGQDWQVRDRRMNIFAKDISLAGLMNSMARVMKFKWSKGKEKPTTYRLIADKKALLDAQRDRQTKMEEARQHYIEGRQRLLSDIEAVDKMSDDELEQLKTQSEYIYTMATGWAKCLPQVFTDVPSAKEAWLRGDGLAVDLSPEAKQRLSNTFIGADKASHAYISLSGFDDTKDVNGGVKVYQFWRSESVPPVAAKSLYHLHSWACV